MYSVCVYVYKFYSVLVLLVTHAAPAQQPVEQSSSAGGPFPHVPSLKAPAVLSVDLSGIPDGTLGEWLCKHTIMTCSI